MKITRTLTVNLFINRKKTHYTRVKDNIQKYQHNTKSNHIKAETETGLFG